MNTQTIERPMVATVTEPQQPLIDYWSYSAMMLFLGERLSFKKKYILKIYDDATSPAAVVGQAAHNAAALYFSGADEEAAIQEGLRYIDIFSDARIDYKKTGSREKIIKDYMQVIGFFFAEIKVSKEHIVGVEESLTTFIEIEGKEMPIPIKAITDAIEEQGDALVLHDWKFCSNYTESDEDRADYILQAVFNYHTTKNKYGKTPKQMVFWECKISLNSKERAGEPQIQPYVVDFTQSSDYFQLFERLYQDCTREIMRPDVQFLPNFRKFNYDSKNALLMYRQNLIDVEAPKIQHKQAQVKYEEKRFVVGVTDKEENKYLTDEEKIRAKLAEFGMMVEMQDTSRGSSIIQYTFKPSRGLRMNQFEKVGPDIARVLKAQTIRVLAPIYGTDLVGIEIPNKDRVMIDFFTEEGAIHERTGIDVMDSESGMMLIPVGVDVFGNTVHKDLTEMPHLMIAGTTGSGKSVMMSVIIHALLAQNTPNQMELVLIDPKRVELARFKHSPHLMAPVIYDENEAIKTLHWLIGEMEERYRLLEKNNCRDINEFMQKGGKMKKIVLVIDEFADLILQRKRGEPSLAETAIVRLAQKARATGIHIVLGTQRPSVDVVTGLLKANLPTRIAFMTASATDSRVILDEDGAEQLSGKGDMLFLDPGHHGLRRLQGFRA